ncbi:DNA-binding protein WhiA, partial [Micrococcus sp. HMSC31B01]
MALTMTLKEELARVPVAATPERRAETAAMLRFAGGLHLVAGRVVVEVELDHGASARRLRAAITELYGLAPEIVVVSGGNLRRGQRYVLRVVRGGEDLARQTGLIDQRGRPVRGLAPVLVSGTTAATAAVWRGALLAHGSLTEPG